jgi:hypothetical protein
MRYLSATIVPSRASESALAGSSGSLGTGRVEVSFATREGQPSTPGERPHCNDIYAQPTLFQPARRWSAAWMRDVVRAAAFL